MSHKLSAASAESILRSILPYYLVLVFAGTVARAVNGYLIHDGWMMGDWLINYQAGMIRRGLLGELIYQLASATHISLGLFVLAIHIVIFASFFYFSYLLLKQQRNLLAYSFLIFSPFVFTFQVNFGGGGFRKETLFIALFAYCIYLANTLDTSRFQKHFAGLMLFFPFIILTHEMLALMLPYFLVVFFSKIEPSKKSFLSVGTLLLPSGLALLTSLYYSGDQTQVDAIKLSWVAIDYEIIGGSVDWLAFSTAIGLEAVKGSIVDKSYLLYYGIVLALSTLAFVPVRHRITRLFNSRVNLSLFVLILLGSLSLFAVAIDWGRFIYMHLIALFLLALLGPEELAERRKPEPRPKPTVIGNKQSSVPLVVFALLLYSQFWYIPHCCEAQPFHLKLSRLNAVSLYNSFTNLVDCCQDKT